MNHRIALLALAPLVAGCGALSGASADATLPTVRGATGVMPQVRTAAKVPDGPHVKVLHEGTGPVTKPGQVVVTDAEIRVWQGNRHLLGTYDTHQPTTISLDGKHVSQTWNKALLGRAAGSRVLLVSPATEGFGPDGRAPAGVQPSDTLIDVFDIIGGYSPTAGVGGAVEENAPGLPPVTVNPGHEPVITPLRTPAPKTLTAHTLVQGTGPQVRAGSKVVVQYVGARWGEPKTFDSSYARGGPNGFDLNPGQVVPGWTQGLTGQRAGSRILLIVPAQMGQNFTATPGGVAAPPGRANVYVIDILDTH